jgi:hypothetical protein
MWTEATGSFSSCTARSVGLASSTAGPESTQPTPTMSSRRLAVSISIVALCARNRGHVRRKASLRLQHRESPCRRHSSRAFNVRRHMSTSSRKQSGALTGCSRWAGGPLSHTSLSYLRSAYPPAITSRFATAEATTFTPFETTLASSLEKARTPRRLLVASPACSKQIILSSGSAYRRPDNRFSCRPVSRTSSVQPVRVMNHRPLARRGRCSAPATAPSRRSRRSESPSRGIVDCAVTDRLANSRTYPRAPSPSRSE